MVLKFPGKVPRNSENCLILEMRTIQRKILKIPGAKLNGKKIRENVFENLGIPREVVLVFANFGKCCSFPYWKLPKIQTRRLG